MVGANAVGCVRIAMHQLRARSLAIAGDGVVAVDGEVVDVVVVVAVGLGLAAKQLPRQLQMNSLLSQPLQRQLRHRQLRHRQRLRMRHLISYLLAAV